MEGRITFTQKKSMRQSLKKKMEATLERNKAIIGLNLGKGDVGDDVLEAAITLLKERPDLAVLRLCNSKFGTSEKRFLLKAMAQNKVITHFELWKSELSKQSVYAIEHLLRYNCVLQCLQFIDSTMTDKAFSSICKALAQNTTMISLSFWRTVFTERSERMITKLIQSNRTLKQIQICDSKFSETDMCTLLEDLVVNTTMQCLCIQRTILTAVSLPSLRKLCSNTQLCGLVLEGACKFTENGFSQLAELLVQLPYIEYVRFGVGTDRHLRWVQSTLFDHPKASNIDVADDTGIPYMTVTCDGVISRINYDDTRDVLASTVVDLKALQIMPEAAAALVPAVACHTRPPSKRMVQRAVSSTYVKTRQLTPEQCTTQGTSTGVDEKDKGEVTGRFPQLRRRTETNRPRPSC